MMESGVQLSTILSMKMMVIGIAFKWKQYASSLSHGKQRILECVTIDKMVDNNGEPRIIIQISHIKFPSLTMIRFYKNDIESIEGLNKVEMPVIKDFSLSTNRICWVTDLKKINWPLLKSFYICSHKVTKTIIISKTLTPFWRRTFLAFRRFQPTSREMMWDG